MSVSVEEIFEDMKRWESPENLKKEREYFDREGVLKDYRSI